MGQDTQKADRSAPKKRARMSRVALVVGALLALEGVALGLKAYEDIQTREQHALESLQREAVALAERLNGQAREASSVVTLGQRSGVGRTELANTLTSLDAILTLRDAAQSPPGSRVKEAADATVAAMTRSESLALTATGDIVLVMEQTGFPSLVAIGPAETWLAGPARDVRFSLVGDRRLGVGNPGLAVATERANPTMPVVHSAENLVRSASACAPVARSNLVACVSRPLPILGTADLLRLLTYALLLAAPLLAIIGLMRMASQDRKHREVEARRAESAQGQLELVMSGARAGSWTWDPVEKQAELSPMAATLLGLAGAGTYSRDTVLERIAENDQAQVTTALDEASIKGWLQVSFATKDSEGQTFVELRASPMVLEGDSGPTGGQPLSGIAMDVTEHRRTDLRLRKAERRLRTPLKGSPAPLHCGTTATAFFTGTGRLP